MFGIFFFEILGISRAFRLIHHWRSEIFRTPSFSCECETLPSFPLSLCVCMGGYEREREILCSVAHPSVIDIVAFQVQRVLFPLET